MEVEVECECPKCGEKFKAYADVDMSENEPDRNDLD